MREVVVVPLSEYEKFKHIERQYNDLMSKKSFVDNDQSGKGTNEVQEVLVRERQHELLTPYLELKSPSDDSSEKNLLEEADGPVHADFDPLDRVPSQFKDKAKQLLAHLQKSNSIAWNSSGNVIIHGQLIQNSNLQNLMRLVFIGVQKGNLPGEPSFFNNLKVLRLESYIRSVHVHDKKWYFLGR
jgi:hypothetical protein